MTAKKKIKISNDTH